MYRIVNRKKLLATVLADWIGGGLSAPARAFRRGEPIVPDSIRSILVIRTAYVGDVMMAVPLLKPLRERFPKASLAFLTAASSAPLLANNPCVDEVIAYDPFWFYPASPKRAYLDFRRRMKNRTFDLVIETRGDIRELLLLVAPLKARHKVSYAAGGGGWLLTQAVPYRGPVPRVEYHLDIARHLGADATKAEWGVHLSAEERSRAGALLREHGLAAPFVAVHPGSRLPLKRWAEDRFAAVCDAIIRDLRLPVALLGSAAEQDIAGAVAGCMREKPVVLAGKLDLRLLAAVLGQAALFICNDSGPMHIAAAMKTPVVAIFGPSKSVETGPYGESHCVVERPFPCRFTCDESHCSHREFRACLESVSAAMVLQAVRSRLA